MIAKLLGRAAGRLPPKEVAEVFRSLALLGSEAMQTHVELKKVEAARQVALDALRRKHDLYQRAFDCVFAERRAVIDKYFETLDRGLESNNQEMVVAALRGLGDIVARSPFTDLKALTHALESGEKIEI